MNNVLKLWLLLVLASCAPQYRDDYEQDARGNAANACHAIGIAATDKSYYDCFQSHFAPAMVKAPTQKRPPEQVQMTDSDVCESYGFQAGTDAFANCLQHRDERRRDAISRMMRPTSPITPATEMPPTINCRSTKLGIYTTTQCN